MYKLFVVVFAAILAVAAAGVVSYTQSSPAVAYTSGVAAPLAYTAGVSPYAYSAYGAYSSPYYRSVASPLAYSAGYVHY